MVKLVESCLIGCLLNMVCSQTNDDLSYTKYKFGFNTGDTGRHTRVEESDAPGHVSGMYSYIDPNGVLRTVRYNSAPGVGYQAYGDGITRFGPEVKPAVFEGYSTLAAMESTKSDAVLENDGNTLKNSQAKLDSDIAAVISIAQLVKENPDTELESAVTTLPNLQIVETMSDAEFSSNEANAKNLQIVETKIDAERFGSGNTPIFAVTDGEIMNDTHSLFVDVTNASSVEAENTTFIASNMITETPNVESLPVANSVFVNHNRLFPYLFPFSSYKFPVNTIPLVYALPQAFTYNIVAPHYQLIL